MHRKFMREPAALGLPRSPAPNLPLPPDPDASSSAQANQTFLVALARAFRWKDLLESGQYSSVKALAAYVGIADENLRAIDHPRLLPYDQRCSVEAGSWKDRGQGCLSSAGWRSPRAGGRTGRGRRTPR
jgi:hypothetical protein